MFISIIESILLIYMSEETFARIFEELVKVRQLLEMTVKDKLEKELEKILTTPERKMVWALSDGFTNTHTIAKKVGVSQRAVQRTVKELQIADLMVVERRGYPKRKFDHVPSEWTSKKVNGG
jgi:DNA-binding HxlR family transcriptional regulator